MSKLSIHSRALMVKNPEALQGRVFQPPAKDGMKLFLLCILCLLSACGYRWGAGDILEKYTTVCVPYAAGDEEGLFTASLIHAVTTRGALRYASTGADLTLKVCLFAPDDINIGFLYAPNHEEGGFSKVITANEGRLTLKAQVSLIDRRSGICVVNPFEIWASLDYDFESDLSNLNKNDFSLGQFEMHNMAQDAAFPPLYTLLAEKIVDYVNNCW